MPENETKKVKQTKSDLVGAQTKPTILDKTTKIDIDVNNKFADNIIEAGLAHKLDISALDQFTSVSNSRDQIYQLIDVMAKDSSVSAILRTYAANVCEVSDSGHIVWCESKDPKISLFVNYLLNVINVDKKIYGWVYCLLKYGDTYLRLYRESDYKDPFFKKDNVTNAYSARNVLNEQYKEKINEDVKLHINKLNDPYSYYVEMVADPGTMYELTRMGVTQGYIEVPNQKMSQTLAGVNNDPSSGTLGLSNFNFQLKSNDVNVYQADDFVHMCLEDDFTRFPETVELFKDDTDYDNKSNGITYSVKRGKSLLIDSYKVWREKSLLEDSAILNRVTKSSIYRKVSVEVGDMPKDKVSQTLHRVKTLMEQKTAVTANGAMAEYTQPGPIENNIYFATRGGIGAVTVDSVGGDVNVKDLADLDYWNNKFYASYGVPKQYYGWCLKYDTPILLLDGTTHTIEELYNNKNKYIGKGILGCNQDGTLCPTKITNIMLTNPKAKYMRIWLDNGKYVDVTPDHKMMLRDGSFIRADELKENDSLMPYYDNEKNPCDINSLIQVTKIEYFDEEVAVYDITVADDCHTFALPCGIFVHNCDDAQGFNGGSSLSIISTEFAREVKRVQNAAIQGITDIINLILFNRGCKSYINNFVLKMREPVTQEEKDYRASLSDKISAISNLNSVLADVEDKSRRLEILKVILSSLNYGDDIITQIDGEIAEANKLKKDKADEEAAKKASETEKASPKEEEPTENENNKSGDFDLGLDQFNLGNAGVAAKESFTIKKEDNKPLIEGSEFLYENNNDLPAPDELPTNKDFTNNEEAFNKIEKEEKPEIIESKKEESGK